MWIGIAQHRCPERNADKTADDEGRAASPLHGAPQPGDAEELRGDAAGEEKGNDGKGRRRMQEERAGDGREGKAREARDKGARQNGNDDNQMRTGSGEPPCRCRHRDGERAEQHNPA